MSENPRSIPKPARVRTLLSSTARLATLVVVGVAETACNLQIGPWDYPPDQGLRDAGPPDTGHRDTGPPDAALRDGAVTSDGGASDASPDALTPGDAAADAMVPDAP